MPQPSPSPHRPRKYSWREILNGILYITRAGCSWRMLPHDLPHWKTVYHYFRLWRKNGLLQKIHDSLRERTRVGAGGLGRVFGVFGGPRTGLCRGSWRSFWGGDGGLGSFPGGGWWSGRLPG
ncbi:transposase [Thermus oshimai]|uniref:transposase n=1 Tax=Thermus oshimai TaxID=56957 RepID=UPI0002F6D81D